MSQLLVNYPISDDEARWQGSRGASAIEETD